VLNTQNFIKKSFHWFNTNDTINWFAERGVALKVESDGRMFPITDSSQTIIDCLLKEADKYGVEIKMQTEILSIEKQQNGFQLQTPPGLAGTKLQTDFLCIATGGYPKSIMFDWLRKTGHQIEEPVPSLFTFNMPKDPIIELMGIAVEKAKIKVVGTKLIEEGPLLVTHWGMSGPLVLRLSAWGARQLADLQYKFMIHVNWLPEIPEPQLRMNWPLYRQDHAAQKIGGKNPFGLPNRLWMYLLQSSGISADTRWSDLSSALQNKLIKNLTAEEHQVNGKTTFKEEFVTCGGINLKEIDFTKFELLRTMLDVVIDYMGEETDTSLGAERDLESTPLSYKIAFNTLYNYGILKEKE
jgi:predicted Rossmann fold flavoprotein